MGFLIKIISLKELLPLRAKILRPGKRIDECIYDSDELSDTFHLGSFDGEKIVSVMSVYKENLKNSDGIGYRIRSMATDENFRGRGLGSELLNYATEEIKKLNGDYIWFNARKNAVNFYMKNGFEIISDEFDINEIGIHFVMMKRFTNPIVLRNIKNLNIKDYSYSLPSEKIAFNPSEKRDNSKLLVYCNDKITDDTFYNLSEYIPSNSLLIFNDTKVVQGRLFFHTEDKSIIEILCVEPFESKDFSLAFKQQGSVRWECMIGKLKQWKDNFLFKEIEYTSGKIKLKAKKSFLHNKFIVEFSWEPKELSFAEILEFCGSTPLPPYIKRNVSKRDSETYQTVYAKNDGSIAAPTAGLHFTEQVLEKIEKNKIQKSFVTLHVNTGTFLPVKTDLIGKHRMHSENVMIEKETLYYLHNNDYPIAVGTTSMRAVESLYWLSYLILNNKKPEDFHITQWLPYETDFDISKKFSLEILIRHCEKNNLKNLRFKTSILIAPGYRFRYFKGLITNFHQPQSTLLLLVSAFLDNKFQNVYEHALDNNYRFLSYGDSNLYLL
ncbi:MAG TPA: GNAT family N-acetyltransferase [Ignavibacteria bacterium]|nr:GNAT family N-acetyltransferase [Ignavibacteria bacterium]